MPIAGCLNFINIETEMKTQQVPTNQLPGVHTPPIDSNQPSDEVLFCKTPPMTWIDPKQWS